MTPAEGPPPSTGTLGVRAATQGRLGGAQHDVCHTHFLSSVVSRGALKCLAKSYNCGAQRKKKFKDSLELRPQLAPQVARPKPTPPGVVSGQGEKCCSPGAAARTGLGVTRPPEGLTEQPQTRGEAAASGQGGSRERARPEMEQVGQHSTAIPTSK